MKNCIRNLDTAISADFNTARETVKQCDIPLLSEIMLDGSPATPSEKPSNMLYLLSFMSHGIDKAIIAKDELNNLLDTIMKEFSMNLLSLRFRMAALKDEAEREAADDGKHN